MPNSVPVCALRTALSLATALCIPLVSQAQFVDSTPRSGLIEASNRIGWNFAYEMVGELDTTDIAGYSGPEGDFQQDHWNNDPTLGQSHSPVTDPPTADIPDLVDANGAATGASLDWSLDTNEIANSWHMVAPLSEDANEKLMYGYQAYDPQFLISNIPYDCYSLVLYYNQDGSVGQSEITVSETGGPVLAQRLVQTGDDGTPNALDYQNAGFVIEDGVGAPSSSSNVTVFSGLTASDLTVQMVATSGNQNSGTSALQIVETSVCIFSDGFESGGTTFWN